MKYVLPPLKYLAFISSFFIPFFSHALDTSTIEKKANLAVKGLYHKLNQLQNISMAERINWIGAQFLGVPYLLGSLGEGPQARYDQFPRYRIDAFDCDTYVNTVVALALANSLSCFQQSINTMRYKNGMVSYLRRNHFTGLDWNQNNQQRGVLKDITLTIKDQRNHPIAQYADALIDKPSWYAHKTVETIRLELANRERQEERLAELKAKGAKLKTSSERLAYLPLKTLFPQKNQADLYLFAQIPDAAIIEIIRPNWDLREKIGTALNISHLGFAIWDKGQLYFRQASSEYGKIVDVPLIDYLAKAQKSPTIKGINVQIVLPENPLTECKKI